MNGEREARFWSNRKKAFREFDHDEMTYATQALMGIYDVLEDIRAILRDIHEDAEIVRCRDCKRHEDEEPGMYTAPTKSAAMTATSNTITSDTVKIPVMDGTTERLPSAHGDAEFIKWLLDEIWDDELWELNYRAFPELLCRRLVRDGWLKEEDGKYVRLESD